MTRLLRHILVLLIVLSMSLFLSGQILRDTNAPRGGDGYMLSGEQCCEAGPGGPDCRWIMPELEAGRTHRRYVERGDTLIRIEYENPRRGNYTLFRYCGDTLKLMSRQGRTYRMDYAGEVPVMVFPMAYGDSLEAVTAARGQNGKRIFTAQKGHLKAKADGKGVLINGSDTIPDVTRLRYTFAYTQVSSPDTAAVGRWFRSEAVDDSILPEYNATDTYYYWYAEGWRYPVMEVKEHRSILSDGDTMKMNHLWTYPPELQLTDLGQDSANITLITMMNGVAQPAMPDWVTSSVPTLAEIDDSLRKYETPPTEKYYGKAVVIDKMDSLLPDSIKMIHIHIMVSLDSMLNVSSLNINSPCAVLDYYKYYPDYDINPAYPEIDELVDLHKNVIFEWASEADYKKYLPYLILDAYFKHNNMCAVHYRLINPRKWNQ